MAPEERRFVPPANMANGSCWRTAVRCLARPSGLAADEGGIGVARSAAASGDTVGGVAADVEVELDGQVGLPECLPGMAESF
jgi:hypothetical protein